MIKRDIIAKRVDRLASGLYGVIEIVAREIEYKKRERAFWQQQCEGIFINLFGGF